jgi:hypothetical protein
MYAGGEHMNVLYRIIVLFSSLLITACMQSGSVQNSDQLPQWVNSEPDMYPNFKYMSATGSASKAEQAKARALSNLAKIFEVQVREVSNVRQDVQSYTESGQETVTKNQRIDSAVNLKTDKMIQGARIAEQWQSSADLTYYALAVLDREQAGNNIRQEMQRLDDDTAFALQQKRNDPLLDIADLNRAYQLQHERQALQKTLKVIDVDGTGLPARWILGELDEQLQRALRALPVTTRVEQDDVGGLLNILQGAVSHAGFKVGQSGYQIIASLNANAPFKRDDWHWLRGTLKLELLSSDGITVIGHQSWPLKVSGNSPTILADRMRDEANKKLKAELLTTLLDFTS